MIGRRALLAVAILAQLSTSPAPAQTTQAPDRWAPVRFLLGTWEGTSDGQPGAGTVRRQYRLVLRDQFIEARNTSTYLPQAKNPKGEVHEDVGYISYDRTRRRLMFRQFHVEGFVNHYVQDAESPSGNVVFTSEAIENVPAGWQARETYVVHGPDEFEEIFELAEAGKPYAVYSRARLKRVR